MQELTVYQQSGLPAQPADLARFIVVAQEKIKSVKAEIRAIQRLEMAKEVYDQKSKNRLDCRSLPCWPISGWGRSRGRCRHRLVDALLKKLFPLAGRVLKSPSPSPSKTSVSPPHK